VVLYLLTDPLLLDHPLDFSSINGLRFRSLGYRSGNDLIKSGKLLVTWTRSRTSRHRNQYDSKVCAHWRFLMNATEEGYAFELTVDQIREIVSIVCNAYETALMEAQNQEGAVVLTQDYVLSRLEATAILYGMQDEETTRH
jgi:hypothetical protein